MLQFITAVNVTLVALVYYPLKANSLAVSDTIINGKLYTPWITKTFSFTSQAMLTKA